MYYVCCELYIDMYRLCFCHVFVTRVCLYSIFLNYSKRFVEVIYLPFYIQTLSILASKYTKEVSVSINLARAVLHSQFRVLRLGNLSVQYV